MTDTPALVRRLRQEADCCNQRALAAELLIEEVNWRGVAEMLLLAADALSLGVARQLEADNDVGLVEERRQFNARIRELESDLGAAIRACAVLEQERDAYIRRWQDESRYHDMYGVKHDEAEKRAEAAKQALTQLRTAFAKLDALCEEVRSSHRDKNSAEYNRCEDGECAWCQETKAALALAADEL